MRPEFQRLSRSDSLPTATELSRERIQLAVAAFGEAPCDVLTGQVKPRHTRRHAHLSEAELGLLATLDLNPGARQPVPDAVRTDAGLMAPTSRTVGHPAGNARAERKILARACRPCEDLTLTATG